jgi:rfaE bifunctional protein nucleotidyltransferase chain/domain
MPFKKIKSRLALKKIVRKLKAKNIKIAFTNGCFDILHLGHVRYLEDAKKCADILVAAVNDDNSVKRLKGNRRPIFPLKDRMEVLAALSSIDYVTSFTEDTPAEIIKFLKPDVIVKGADYSVKNIVGRDIVKSYGGKTIRVKYLKGYSVSRLIKRITGRYQPQ